MELDGWYGGTVERWYGGTPSAIPRSAVEVKALGRWLVSRVLARSRALLFIPKEFQPDSARIGLENFGEHSRENARMLLELICAHPPHRRSSAAVPSCSKPVGASQAATIWNADSRGSIE